MEWQRTFFVNAAADYVSQWLEDTTRASWREWLVDCGAEREGMYLTVQPARPAWPQQPPKVILEMEGHYTYPVEKTDEGLDVLESTGFFPVVRFELLPVGTERTQVAAKCLHRAVGAHLEALLAEMAKAWPEMGAQGATDAKQERRNLGLHGGTLDRVKEAYILIRGGEKKTYACRRVGIDTRTYDRYADEVIDWAEDG